MNETLAELNNDWVRYGEQLYWITVMGTPSATQPWGFQIDGHHLIINYFSTCSRRRTEWRHALPPNRPSDFKSKIAKRKNSESARVFTWT